MTVIIYKFKSPQYTKFPAKNNQSLFSTKMILTNNNSHMRYPINDGNNAPGGNMYSPNMNMSKKSPALTHNGSNTNPEIDPSNNKHSHIRNNTHPSKMISCFTQTNIQDCIYSNDRSSYANRHEGSISFTAIQAKTHNQCQPSHSQRNKENHQPNQFESMADILSRNSQIAKQLQQLNMTKNNNINFNLNRQINTRNQYCSIQPQISQFLPQQLQNVTLSKQSNQAHGEQSPNSLLMQNLNNIMSVKMNTKQLQQELQHFINIITKLRKQNDYYKQQLQTARQNNRQILNELHEARMGIVDAQEHNDRLSRMLTIWKQRATILKQMNEQQLIGQHGNHTLYQYSQQGQQYKQYQQQYSPPLREASQSQQNSTYSHLLYNCKVGRSMGRSRANSIGNNNNTNTNNNNSINGNGSSDNSINISQLLKMKQQRCNWDGLTKNKQQQNLYGKIVRSNSKADRYPQSGIHAQGKPSQYQYQYQYQCMDQSTIM